MSSIFVIAKTSPGAGFKKIFKIFQSPKYDNYIWHAAYEIEKEFYFRFQMTNMFGTRLMNLKKDVQLWFSNDKYIWHGAYETEKYVRK